ncbi:MAG TPA: hypothetical protein VLJ62_22515, partial [Burkholderiaceae bacterium]|nr:hypothetical protein [Burkholderiaceae bacterium]
MDAPLEPIRGDGPSSTSMGGSVTPVDRLAAVKSVLQSANAAPTQERYELRDPFAEVTYRANTLTEVVAKAEQLGSSRFVAVDAEGRRTPVQKV